jgi:ribosomal protein S12 methylthiotransferase
MQEAENLVNSGVKELLVVSQDTSAYGIDTKYQTGFWNGRPVKSHIQQLAESLGELDAWVRLHYVYPYPHVDKLIPLMAENAENKGLLPYLDIPFQHASHRILKDMRRPAHAEKVLSRIQNWRAMCPDITIRSTFIAGFPGETEEDFELLLDFIREAQLNRVGCFAYSEVDGAVSNDLPNHVPEDEKQHRLERFMEVQAEISANKLAAKIGQRMTVLTDDTVQGDTEAEDLTMARSSSDAPEIDGLVYIQGEMLEPGQFAEVEITHSDEHDLWAKLVE